MHVELADAATHDFASESFDVAISRYWALESGTTALVAAPAPHDAFSLADPRLTERTLDAAGFVELSFRDVQVPVYYGSDVAAALE